MVSFVMSLPGWTWANGNSVRGVSVQASVDEESDCPWLSLQESQDLPVTYTGVPSLLRTLKQDDVQPLSLVAADFDEDGVPDLVAGYGAGRRGIITLHRGNGDAIYPNSPQARARQAASTFTAAAFLPEVQAVEVPAAPEFLGAGDFDADGHRDIVFTARGDSHLTWLPGDGQGGFESACTVPLPGGVTALTVGDVNRRDGLDDVLVGVRQATGAPLVLVFEGADGALSPQVEPETLALPDGSASEIVALAVGQLDDHYAIDLAVAAGRDVYIIHGRDRKLALGAAQQALVQPATVDRRRFPFAVRDLVLGDFLDGAAASDDDVALLGDDGRVHLWDVAEDTLTLHATDFTSSASHILRADVSSLPTDDLLIVDGLRRQVHVIVTEPDSSDASRFPTASSSVVLTMADDPVAVLPMRLNQDGLNDLVILKRGPNPLAISLTAPSHLFVVNSAGDQSDPYGGDNMCDICNDPSANPPVGPCGVCTLRAAIEQANYSAGPDEIGFSFVAQPIAPASALPDIEETLTIDGSTNEYATQLDGSSAGDGVNGFNVAASSSVVRGMVIYNFQAIGIQNGFGIALLGDNNVVEGNYLGTDKDGVVAQGNENGGVVCGIGSGANTIGGTTEAARNLISGNGGNGVQLSEGGGNSNDNVVIGNLIGVDVSGEQDLGNGAVGVMVTGGSSTGNVIGGTDETRRNVISGNDGHGVAIQNGATGNLVQGNYIGTNITGTAGIPNGVIWSDQGDGVQIVYAADNTVGGTAASMRNIIAGNYLNGVDIYDPHGMATAGKSEDGDRVGAPAEAFSVRHPAAPPGVDIASPQAVTQATGNRVQGNYIGLTVNGTGALGNYGSGVMIANGDDNVVGGTEVGARNVIAANLGDGVTIMTVVNGTAVSNTVAGNYIGTDNTGIFTDPDGTPGNSDDLGNWSHGVIIGEASGNVVGGTEAGAGNVIAGNKGYGVYIAAEAGKSADRNQVQGNAIGTDAEALLEFGNGKAGVFIERGARNEIGGTGTATNTIAYNGGAGVVISGTQAIRNQVLGNRIYLNHERPIDLEGDRFTFNDDGDTDTGANQRQNFPVLTALQGQVVTGTLESTPETAFRLEFFSYEVCDPLDQRDFVDGMGDAERYLTFKDVTTDKKGQAAFTVTLPSALPPGYTVAATATDPEGNTSELSNAPFYVRTSTSSFIPQSAFRPYPGGVPNASVLLYTVFDQLQATELAACGLKDVDLYLVVNGDEENPLKMENNAEGANDRAHADFHAGDVHHSLWFTPTQAEPYDIDLYAFPKGDPFAGADGAGHIGEVALQPESTPELVVLTDFRELFKEFNLTAPNSTTQDEDENGILDYYDGVERVRRYAAGHKGIVIDVRKDAYTDDFDYQVDGERAAMPPTIDWLVARIPDAAFKFVAVVGDDAVVPFYRYPDPKANDEEKYWKNVDHGVGTVKDSHDNTIITDVPYSTRTTATPETPEANLALGRIFARGPLTLTQLIDVYEQPVVVGAQTGSAVMFSLANERNKAGAITFNWHNNTWSFKELVRANGYITAMVNTNQRGTARHYGWVDPESGWTWGGDQVEYVLQKVGDNRLTIVNSHAHHMENKTHKAAVPFRATDDLDPLGPFPGAVLLNIGCHGGYSTGHDATADPKKWNYYHDALVRGALDTHLTYHASTTYGQTTANVAMRYNDRVHYQFLHYLLNDADTTGEAHMEALKSYYVHHKKADFIDRDVIGIYGTELYGLPTQPIQRAPGGAAVQQIHRSSAAPSVAALQASETLTVSLDAPHFRVSPDEAGDTLFEVPHGGEMTALGNGPYVPLLVRSFYFPAGTTGLTVTLIATDTALYTGTVQLSPQMAGDRSFGVKVVPYTDTAPYPDVPFWTTVYTDAEGVKLTISAVPLRYDPVAGQVTLYHGMDFRVDYDLPEDQVQRAAISATPPQIEDVRVNGGIPVSIQRADFPMTMTVTSAQTQTLSLRWLIEDAGGAPIRSGRSTIAPFTGIQMLAWDGDSLGWQPGPKVLHVRLEDETGAQVATGQVDFMARGRSLRLSTEQGVYDPGDTQATIRAEVRDETGAQVPGLTGDFLQQLDGTPLSLTWHGDGVYTATLDLMALDAITHILQVGLSGGPTEQILFGIDHSPPDSTLSSPAFAYAPDGIPVTISGDDDQSGTAAFYLQYRVGPGGAWTDWLTRTAGWDYSAGMPFDLAPVFGPAQPVALQAGTTYYFRVRAVDRMGNEEPVHALADTSTVYTDCVGLDGVTIIGPNNGITDTAYAFTATVTPPTATCPIVFDWTPAPTPGSLLLPGRSVVTYTWQTRGHQVITVTATNCGGDATATHRIFIDIYPEHVYLPLVLRNYQPPPPADRYVKRYGDDTGDCSTPETACATIQHAVDVAEAGDVIAIAGYEDAYAYPGDPEGNPRWTYWATESRPKPSGYNGAESVTQVVLIDESVTLRGGYDAGFSAHDPETYKTVIRPGLSGGAGRGVLIAPFAEVTLEDLIILEGDVSNQGGVASGDYTFDGGGGIYALGVSYRSDALVIRNCTIAGNVASSGVGYGGGVYLDSRPGAVLEDNAIYGNFAGHGYGQFTSEGGGVYARYSDDVRLEYNLIHDNVACDGGYGQGGGVNLYALADPTVQGNQVISNTGTLDGVSAIGGGLYLRDVTGGVVAGNVISGNVAGGNTLGAGGGMSAYESEGLSIHRNLFYGNIAALAGASSNGSNGGAIRLGDACFNITLANNFIVRNQSPYGGSGVMLDPTQGRGILVVMYHNTIADNGLTSQRVSDGAHQRISASAIERGSEVAMMLVDSYAVLDVPQEAQGIMAAGSVELTAINNIIAGHTRGVFDLYPDYSTLTFDYTLWHGNATAADASVTRTNDVYGDPAFVDPLDGDYHIGAGSAARDAGASVGVAVDFDGDPRDAQPDIGADEYK